MEITDRISNQNKCSTSSMNEMKMQIVNVIKYFKHGPNEIDKYSTRVEFHLIFSVLEQNLKDSFLKMLHTICISKKQTRSVSSVLEEFDNLLVLIFEQLSAHKIAHVDIPSICCLAAMMYFVEPTFPSSQDILIMIFAHYRHLRLFILDNMYKTMILLQSQNLLTKYSENIAKSILFFMQSIPAVANNVNISFIFDEAQQQIQALTIHWISLFISDIDSNVTNEHLPKIFNNFIRYTVKMLYFVKFPSVPFVLTIILRTLMSLLSSVKSSLQLKRLALEHICFVVIKLKKIVDSSSVEENVRIVSNIHEALKLELKKPEKCVDADICAKSLLIQYMGKQYSDTNPFLSPIPFLRLNFLRHIADNNKNEKDSDGTAKKRKLNASIYEAMNDNLKYYCDLLKTVSYDLNRGDADIIYHYLVFSKSDLRIFVDRYFERVILITAAKHNSLRLSAVKQLVPLVEVNNNLLSSRILKIAIRSLILDHSHFVRENILIALAKIILLNEPRTYAVIFEENCENILMRLLDVNVGVRKAVINLLKSFCLKNRNDKKVLRILSGVLGRVYDKDESVKFQAADIFKQLWFIIPDKYSENSVAEIIHLSNDHPETLLHLFNYIFLENPRSAQIALFDVSRKILVHVANNNPSACNSKLDNLNRVLTKLSARLSKKNIHFVAQL